MCSLQRAAAVLLETPPPLPSVGLLCYLYKQVGSPIVFFLLPVEPEVNWISVNTTVLNLEETSITGSDNSTGWTLADRQNWILEELCQCKEMSVSL